MEQNKKLWFRRKRYGWGWFPNSLEGWAVLVVYLILMIDMFLGVDAAQRSNSDTLINFVPRWVILTAILIAVCYWKGEKPKWSWGKK